ncbi:MAG: cbb3-type cytochrome c oxidase subunit 3 [Acetobacteraceae bacterium]|nr:cbb3-type cytochrome c oxidase subunit 3 [Acetobacteraceae bacterium]
MHDWQPVFTSLWVIWFFVLFGGILVWILRPSQRAKWQERGSIPFRDDAPTHRIPR